MTFSPEHNYEYMDGESWKENIYTSPSIDTDRRMSSPPFVTSAGEEIDSPPDIKQRSKRERKLTSAEDDEKPSYSYIALISMAILQHPERKMMLGEIYNYITDKYPYYRNMADRAWRNSIRHNLSLNECFIKCGRADNGKGNYWSIHQACSEDFKKGDFRRRQARRRARRAQHSLDVSRLPMSYRCHLGYVPMSNQHTNRQHFHPSPPSNVSHPYSPYVPYTYVAPSGYPLSFQNPAGMAYQPLSESYSSPTPSSSVNHMPSQQPQPTEHDITQPIQNVTACKFEQPSIQSEIPASLYTHQQLLQPELLTNCSSELKCRICHHLVSHNIYFIPTLPV